MANFLLLRRSSRGLVQLCTVQLILWTLAKNSRPIRSRFVSKSQTGTCWKRLRNLLFVMQAYNYSFPLHQTHNSQSITINANYYANQMKKTQERCCNLTQFIGTSLQVLHVNQMTRSSSRRISYKCKVANDQIEMRLNPQLNYNYLLKQMLNY